MEYDEVDNFMHRDPTDAEIDQEIEELIQAKEMQQVTQVIAVKQHPTKPGEWSLAEIQAAISKELPKSMLRAKKLGGQSIPYIPWHRVNKILDKYCLGWTWEIKNIHTTDSDLFLVGRLTIPTADGLVYREATGTEKLNCSSYGDASSNAESQAFRRAAAKFGLALYLYEKD